MNPEAGEHQLQEFLRCHQRRDVGRSFSHLSLALCILPHLKQEYYNTFLQVFEEWSSTVEETRGLQEVMTICEAALSLYPHSPDLQYLLAKILYRHGSLQEAWNYACLAQVSCPRDPNTQDTWSRLTNALVDRWHLPMINDKARNSAFKQAIERAVTQGHQTVLDIGSGTGLLSLYARKAGATEVYACEVDKFMCEMGLSILQLNLGTSCINMLNKHSKNIIIPKDIPQRLSLVVSETIDAGLFGEHILSTLQHAWQQLLLPPPSSLEFLDHKKDTKFASVPCKSQSSLGQATDSDEESACQTFLDPSKISLNENDANESKGNKCYPTDDTVNDTESCFPLSAYGRVIPSKAEVFIALISCKYISRQTKLINHDFQCFKNKNVCIKLEEPYMSEKLSQVPEGFQLLSRWTQVTTVNFNSLEDIMKHQQGEIDKTLDVQCTESGSLDAIVLAFNLQLDDEVCINSFPETCQTLWENAVYPVTTVTNVVASDRITVGIQCDGVMRLSFQKSHGDTNEDNLYLNARALRFLNSNHFTSAYISAVHHIDRQFQEESTRGTMKRQLPLIICDTTPFPVAGMMLLSYWPDSKLYVEDEDIQAVLGQLGVVAGLCEDLEEAVDVLFLWPLTGDGTLKDDFVKKVLLYRLMMAEDGVVFPQEMELIIGIMGSPALTAMTCVDDSNTCGAKVAEIFNLVQTVHQLDVPLSALPDITEAADSTPVLRLSLSTGNIQPLLQSRDSRPKPVERDNGLMVLGGEIVDVFSDVTFTQTTTITALPYWFHLRTSYSFTDTEFTKSPLSAHSSASASDSQSTEVDIFLSTKEKDSPCNQSVLLLKDPLSVVIGEGGRLEVVWREGIFNATLIHLPLSD